jgi:hypothetical protein
VVTPQMTVDEAAAVGEEVGKRGLRTLSAYCGNFHAEKARSRYRRIEVPDRQYRGVLVTYSAARRDQQDGIGRSLLRGGG